MGTNRLARRAQLQAANLVPKAYRCEGKRGSWLASPVIPATLDYFDHEFCLHGSQCFAEGEGRMFERVVADQ
jgi:hypothetical protein